MTARYPDNEQTLATALGHVWSWYEFRYGQVTQILNFYAISIAVLTTGYVTALNSKLYIPAGAVGLIGTGLSVATLLVGTRLRDSALLASQPLAIIQERLATSLDIEELQMVERHRTQNVASWNRISALPLFIFCMGVVTGHGAVLYAWLGH